MWVNGKGDVVLNGKSSPNVKPKSASIKKSVSDNAKPKKNNAGEYKPLPNPKGDQERRMWVNGKGDIVLNGKSSPDVKPKPASTKKSVSMSTKAKNISVNTINKGKSFVSNLFNR